MPRPTHGAVARRGGSVQTCSGAAGELRAVLRRETSGRVSLSSFTGQYLPLLNFPADVLAHLTPERLDIMPHGASRLRRELIQAHANMKGSQNARHTRVRELLWEAVGVSSAEMAAVVQKIDELLEIDPADKRHFFYEEMKRLFYAMRHKEPKLVMNLLLPPTTQTDRCRAGRSRSSVIQLR